MIEISKELLSEILEKSINRFSVCDNYLYYTRDIEVQEDEDLIWIDCEFKINIYELIHKGKEWAFNKGYSVSVFQSELSGYIVEIKYGFNLTDFHNISEVEAIIQACEWICKEINK